VTGRVVVVTGTSTGVGKTVVTAALAAHATALGRSVAVVKPVQTGTDDGDSDAREIHHLTGVEVHEHTTLAEPLAPDTAARRAGVAVPTVAEYADRIAPLTASHDLVLVDREVGRWAAEGRRAEPEEEQRELAQGGPLLVHRRPAQHSMMFTARPPRAVSLYLVLMSAPVWRIVAMTLSSETLCLPSPDIAMRAALIALTLPIALRSMQGT